MWIDREREKRGEWRKEREWMRKERDGKIGRWVQGGRKREEEEREKEWEEKGI